ncbi:hypothetical protein JXI42_01035 [bacterium]|nr:hypothetical protein [bacterium]
MKKNEKKKPPVSTSENEAVKFWGEAESVGLVDYSKAEKAILPDLKHTSKAFAVRMPNYLLFKLNNLAHKNKVSCQSIVIDIIEEKLIKKSPPKK